MLTSNDDLYRLPITWCPYIMFISPYPSMHCGRPSMHIMILAFISTFSLSQYRTKSAQSTCALCILNINNICNHAGLISKVCSRN